MFAKLYRSVVDVDTGDAMYVVYCQQEKTEIRYHFKGTADDSKQIDIMADGLTQNRSVGDLKTGRSADTIELYHVDYPIEYWHTTITSRAVIFIVNHTIHGELFIAMHLDGKTMHLDGKTMHLDGNAARLAKPSLADYSFLIQYDRSAGITGYLVCGKKLTQTTIPKAAVKIIRQIASEKLRLVN